MFDPLYATDGETFRVTRQMFEGLLGIEPGSAEVVPELATEWTSNEDGTVWTFTLRDDVTFHDGEPFNAEAVCANFERMFDQNEAGQVAAEYWGYVMGGFANDPEGLALRELRGHRRVRGHRRPSPAPPRASRPC